MIRFSAILTVKAAFEAVENDGDALQYVKEQSEAVCLKAVENDGDALQYVLSLELFIKIAGQFGIKIDKSNADLAA